MAGVVYSTRFLAANVTGAPAAAAAKYTVPAGKVAVVRDIDFFVDSPGIVIIGRVAGTTFNPFAGSGNVSQYLCGHWDGYQVLDAGNELGCQWLGGSVRIIASGFLFNVL